MKRFARYERRNPPDKDKAKRRKSFDMFGIVGGCTELENPEREDGGFWTGTTSWRLRDERVRSATGTGIESE